MLLIAALAHILAGLPRTAALLLGAVLGPTDRVFAAAVIGRVEIPFDVLHTLNVESGLPASPHLRRSDGR